MEKKRHAASKHHQKKNHRIGVVKGKHRNMKTQLQKYSIGIQGGKNEKNDWRKDTN